MIEERLVFLFAGFEPMRADAHIRRFLRGAESAAALWDRPIWIAPGPAATEGDGDLFPTLLSKLESEGSQTRAEIVFCDWGDLILAYRARPAIRRFASGLLALADFLVTGTVFRYFRVSWRYGLFYLFPLAIVAGAIALGSLCGFAVAAALGGTAGVLLGIVIGFALALAALVLADRRLHLLTAMDDWAMALDLCRGRNPAIIERMERQGAVMAALMASRPAQEIVVAAHSLGASMAVAALRSALSGNAARAGRVRILTVGSSLMKTALHPAAAPQRRAVAALVVDHRIPWTDCQSLSDPINFYKSNPATSLGLRDGRTPDVVRIHFKQMLKPETYRRIKRDFFRVHRQFVLPVERRCAYSFHMLLLGPRSVADFAATRSVDIPTPGESAVTAADGAEVRSTMPLPLSQPQKIASSPSAAAPVRAQ
ncbi:hypothetical protein [Aurantimonas sp. VKM B-3413]|uniref:hypothetical protein n=1 Tax=Aurantimonas sp. VKM B-3413 TaxID=2779401 RepID=UPI001E413EE8|nr:hypothetical protein [Aurantimonas sp. VKM B-3413]MCB8837432.1 hypothetical protein [Aurantimonas sp. VKM B-3413]